MIEYNVKNLKEQFPELKKHSDFVLAPLFDTAFLQWVSRLKESPIVTDAKKDERGYEFVINGRFVNVNSGGRVDIDVVDEDERVYVASSFYINGDENSAERLFGNFREFMGRQKLEELVAQTRESFKGEKTYHFSGEMVDFYEL